MNQIVVNQKTSNIDGVKIDASTITVLKNTVLDDTLTIKLIDRSTENLTINVENNAIVKIIFEIQDALKTEANYNIVLNTFNNTNVKFLFIADVAHEGVLNFKGNAYNDSNIEFIGSFISNKLTAKVHLDLLGRGANLKVRTITVSALNNNQVLDVHMIHHAPNTFADMTNIGIASGEGIVKLNGVGEINQGMKGSSAFQTLRGIITSDQAQIDVNPILIIDEFDVTAGHAATVGKIEEEVLYYLMSRGLPEVEAQKLIIYGFLRPVLDEIDDALIKEHVEKIIDERI